MPKSTAKKIKNSNGVTKLTAKQLADKLGEVLAQKAKWVSEEKALKNEIKKRVSAHKLKDCFEGNLFRVVLSEYESVRLDTQKIYEDMDEDWLEEHTKICTAVKISCTAKTGLGKKVA